MSKDKGVVTGRQHKSVCAYFKSRGRNGATDWEIESALGLTHQSASARRRELVVKGLVADAGLTRMGGHGRKVTVWVAREWKRQD